MTVVGYQEKRMDREEKLLLTYFITAFFALCFHLGTTEERMAHAGFTPYRLVGSRTVYWLKPIDRSDPNNGSVGQLKTF